MDFDPLRFATRLDLLATVTTVLGFAAVLGGAIWAIATIFGSWGYGDLNSAAFVVPCLGIWMLALYCFATADGLRRFRQGARQAQGALALLFAATIFGLPYAIWSWCVLHGFKARHYFEARARGLSAEEAITSIHETVHSSVDGPLTRHYPEPRVEPEAVSWWPVVLSALGGAALAAVWAGAFELMKADRRMFPGELFMVYIAMASSFWLVAIQPFVFRRGTKGPIIVMIAILVFAMACAWGIESVQGDLYRLYREKSGF
jgi:hypothetical protein